MIIERQDPGGPRGKEEIRGRRTRPPSQAKREKSVRETA